MFARVFAVSAVAGMLLVLPPGVRVGAQVYYTSNAIGSQIDYLADSGGREAALAAAEYVLEVTRTAAVNTERLYRDGEEVRRTVIETKGGRRSEEVYKEQVISSTVDYNSSGRITREQNYDKDGVLTERIEYTYSLDEITVSAYDGAGELIFTERQELAPNGRVGGITREYSDGEQAIARFGFLDRLLLRELHSDGRENNWIDYDSGGRVIRKRAEVAGVLEQEEFVRYEHVTAQRVPSKSERVTVLDEENSEFVEIVFDTSGNIRQQTVSVNGIPIEIGEFDYSEGKLVRSRIRRTGATSFKEIIFDDAGVKLAERWYDHGKLVRAVVDIVDEEVDSTHYEERYLDGEPYVRIYFSNTLRQREEFMVDGDVIRTRVLAGGESPEVVSADTESADETGSNGETAAPVDQTTEQTADQTLEQPTEQPTTPNDAPEAGSVDVNGDTAPAPDSVSPEGDAPEQDDSAADTTGQ